MKRKIQEKAHTHTYTERTLVALNQMAFLLFHRHSQHNRNETMYNSTFPFSMVLYSIALMLIRIKCPQWVSSGEDNVEKHVDVMVMLWLLQLLKDNNKTYSFLSFQLLFSCSHFHIYYGYFNSTVEYIICPYVRIVFVERPHRYSRIKSIYSYVHSIEHSISIHCQLFNLNKHIT